MDTFSGLSFFSGKSDASVLYKSDVVVERATPSDAIEISKLLDKNTILMFGDVDVNELLCKGLLTLIVRDEKGKITTAVSLNCYPNVPTLCSSHWQRWVANLFKVENLSPKNTLWCHLVAHKILNDANFLRPILEKIFHLYPYYKYCLFLLPPGSQNMVIWFKKHTLRVLPVGQYVARKVMTLRIAHQKNFTKNYKLRRAVEEDNDDLVPLINSHSMILKERYGQFYIAEILKRHSDFERQIIVAEFKNQAVAVVFLNNNVNVKSLNQFFELEPFYGLSKPSEKDLESYIEQPKEKALSEEEEEEEQEGNGDNNRMREKYGDTDDDDTYYSSFSSSTSSSGESKLVSTGDILHQLHRGSSEDAEALEFSRQKVKQSHSDILVSSSSSEFSLEIDLGDSSDEFDNKVADKDYKSLYDKDMSLLRLTEEKNPGMVYGHSDVEFAKLIQYSLSVKTDDEVVESSPLVEIDVTEYFGESNAFAIELAAAWPVHEHALFHLLTTCFECYPSKDMCILTLPSTTMPFPLLRHFVRATPRNISNYPQELYIVHKNSIAGFLNIRLAKKYDLLQINTFLASIQTEEDFLMLFINAFKWKYTTYLILCGTDLVGTCILKEENHVEFLRRCYDLEEVTSMQRHKAGLVGQIIHLIISPIFQPHVEFFMREILRVSEYTLLTYKIYSTDSEYVKKAKSTTVMLSNLIPIMPKKGVMEEKYLNYPEYALYISTMYLSSLPKIEVNNRITIVGSSIITTSFLENLIYNKSAKSHIIFNNITVLAPHLSNTTKQMFLAREKFFIIHSEYLSKYIRLINLATYVNYVDGVMTGIDRKNKRLIVNSDSSLPYDILFLLCGVQFPNPVFSNLKIGETSRNIYIVNTNVEASNALVKLKKQVYTTTNETFNIIVYGVCLEVYTCIAALLEFGIQGSNIVYMEAPASKLHNFVLPDSEVDTAVIDTMTSLGVRIHSGFQFVDCKFEDNRHKATHCIFESSKRRLELECFAMFMFQDKCVSTKTFLAINRAGLVFDGRLVIGPDFKTNDPNIYAAGTLTKYSRKYYADHMVQKYYNREEIGEKLANQMLEMMIPSYSSDCGKILDFPSIKCDFNATNSDKLMPRFLRPLFVYCALPGNLCYLHITKPGLEQPLETQMTDETYGEILSTGDCKRISRQGYFKIHLNQYNIVETITCLSNHEIDYLKILSLYGKHERLLNNLVLRCEMVLIRDFYEYFNQEWMSLLFHNEFRRCEINTMNELIKLEDTDGKLLIQTVIEQLEKADWKNLNEKERRYIRNIFNQANYKPVVEKYILNLIGDHLDDFPMYAHPVVVRMLLQSAGSPLFQEM